MTVASAESTAPIRVLYVTHIGAPTGNASSLRLLIAGFPTGAVEAHLLTPPGGAIPDFERLGVSIWSIPGIAMVYSTVGIPLRGRRLLVLLRTIWHMRKGSRVREVIRAVRPDVVHMNDIGMFQVARIARQAGVPTVMHVRGVLDQDSRWVLRLLRGMVRKWVMQTVAIDESVGRGLRQVAESVVVYNPLPRDLLDAPTAAGAARSGPVRVTFLNTLIGYKGVYDLLESARLLRDRSDILFQIAGTNSRPMEFYASLIGRISRLLGLTRNVEAEARDFVARQGLQDQVRLLGRVDPGAILRETDVLVFPSHLNGAGRSVFEAGVLGIPAILTLRDRVEDIVQDGVTGLIVPERDPQGLAAAIARLADDPELRCRLGAQARRRYRLQFDGESISREIITLYRSILSDPDAGVSRRDSFESEVGAGSQGGS